MNQLLGRRIAALCLSGMLSACDLIGSTPEGQAQDFIETLITAPGEAQKLRDIAKLPAGHNPEDVVEGVAGRVGVDFLRAQRTQGISLKFVRGQTRKPSATQRQMGIHVSYLQPGTTLTGEVRFLVRAEKDEQGFWRITGVTGEN